VDAARALYERQVARLSASGRLNTDMVTAGGLAGVAGFMLLPEPMLRPEWELLAEAALAIMRCLPAGPG
jgi:hypothetical protein